MGLSSESRKQSTPGSAGCLLYFIRAAQWPGILDFGDLAIHNVWEDLFPSFNKSFG